MFSKVLTLLALVASGTLSIATLEDSRSLAPVQRRSGLVTRGVDEVLKLQPEVILSFAENDHSHGQTHISIADVRFRAQKEIPILLLEDFEQLTSSISCGGNSISITFTGHAHCNFARNEWTQYDSFVLISSHYSAGCNGEEERGAFLVRRVQCEDSGATCVLQTEVLEWHKVGESMSVSFGQISPEEFDEGLVRRQTTNSDPKLNTTSLDKSFPGRTKLWPLPGASNANPGLEVNCVDCGVRGNLGVLGDFELDLNPLDGDGFDIDAAFVEVKNTKAINATLKLEFAFNLAGPLGLELSVPLMPRINLASWQVPGIFAIGPYFEFNLLFAPSLTGEQLNFTFGTTVEVPTDSVAHFDMVKTSNSSSRGWDKTRIEKIPFQLNKFPETFKFGLNATLAPAVGFEVSILRSVMRGSANATGLTAGPSIEFSAPKFIIAGEFLRNVTSNCTALTATDYNYYPKALQLSLTPEFGVSASLTAEANHPRMPGFSGDISVDIFSVTGPTIKDCLVFGSGRTVGEMTPANGTQPQIDVSKVKEYTTTHKGQIPQGVNVTQLATVTGGPGATPKPTSEGKQNDGSRAGPGWLVLAGAFSAGTAFVLT